MGKKRISPNEDIAELTRLVDYLSQDNSGLKARVDNWFNRYETKIEQKNYRSEGASILRNLNRIFVDKNCLYLATRLENMDFSRDNPRKLKSQIASVTDILFERDSLERDGFARILVILKRLLRLLRRKEVAAMLNQVRDELVEKVKTSRGKKKK